MHFGVVVDGVHHRVEGFLWRDRRRCECFLGVVDVLAVNGVANGITGHCSGGQSAGRDRVQHFVFASAEIVNAIRVSIQHFQNGQSLLVGRQLLRHLISRQHGHHRVEADVVLAAEGSRVRESCRPTSKPCPF